MELNEAQRQAVRTWVASGASLADVQKRLKAEFDLSLTFMEARLLVLEIGAQVRDQPEPRKAPVPAQRGTADDAAAEADYLSAEDAIEDVAAGPPPRGKPSKVKVSLDKIVPAGAMLSGKVVFSDGTPVRWMLDRLGRLGLEGAPPNFRPSPEDVREFQVQLQALMASRGY